MSRTATIAAIICLLAVPRGFLFSQENSPRSYTMEEWIHAMREESAARDELKNAIDSVKLDLARMATRDSMLTDEIRKANGDVRILIKRTQARQKEYEQLLEKVDTAVSTLRRLSPEQLPSHQQNLDSVQSLISVEEKDMLADRYEDRIMNQQKTVEYLKSLMEREDVQMTDRTVTVRDWTDARSCLWNIARSPSVYGDPFLWVKIWESNKSSVPNPDIIYPGQHLVIPPKSPLTSDEHLMLLDYLNRKEFWKNRTLADSQSHPRSF